MGANVLLVCDQPKAEEFFRKFLQQNHYDVVTISNGEEAKRICMEQTFETCIINAPLHGEKAEQLARALAQKNMFQVILFVKAEVEAETSVHMEKYGVITLGKPVHTKLFWDALRLSKIANNRIQMLMHENMMLQKKMKELKLVTQAKLILMQSLNISEEAAHRKIEKMAMDQRLSKREIAQEIISTYE
ncbi:MAG: response regulator [Lachnospiraceae bacterium]|nr:response regulator [Lachnospiraceae bacterium]